MSHSSRDLTPLPDLLHDTALAGPVRTRRPVYIDLLPPCNGACPAGENIQAYLASTRAGQHERAWRQLTADNPFPAIHGRVCYHPCESAYNRAELDTSVSIHPVEDSRLLAAPRSAARTAACRLDFRPGEWARRGASTIGRIGHVIRSHAVL